MRDVHVSRGAAGIVLRGLDLDIAPGETIALEQPAQLVAADGGRWNSDTLDPNRTSWDAGSVTQATKKLLEEFEALPDRERSELVAELARRVALAPHDGPSDEDLLGAADRLFLELDLREQS